MRKTYIVATLLTVACAPGSSSDEAAQEAYDETGIAGPFEATPAADGKFDADGDPGPRVADGVATEVWAVTRDWMDTDGDAGMAWSANSGLTWEQKFDAWVASFERIPRSTGYGETFRMSTPWDGRTFESPTLECAEVALFLRATFASWYGLPFFIEGWDSHTSQRMYAGHFGFINASGENIGRFPSFRTRYRDYTGEWRDGQAWPSDSRLRGYRLGDDDGVPSLEEGAGAGAYFDEIMLNKRVGYFLRLLLLYYGSTNLADEANMFHIEPVATRPGDSLIERWQKRGIGHVLPVMQVDEPVPGRLQVALASGSMPRRQPLWEEPNRARSKFTLSNTGGEGTASDGTPYAELGGGIRRWRTAVRVSGRWRNVVNDADLDHYIDPGDTAAIAARPDEFREILADVSPEEQVEVALVEIDAARMHLRDYPASCAARTRREDAFERLYELTHDLYGWTRSRTDAEHRTLEDHVFAELEYEVSRTCCWNRSTATMHMVVMDYARAEQADAEADGMCVAPSVFRAELEGYARWADHAATLGLAGEWRDWSEDEACSQRDVAEDTVAPRAVTSGAAFCESGTTDPVVEPEPEPEPGDACDLAGQDDSQATALRLTAATSGTICGGDSDWYLVPEGGEVVVTFSHAAGDLDLEAFDVEGGRLGQSAGVSDEERYGHDGPFAVRVYGYSGATGDYTITVN
ncbi:MAG: hypothetical protein CMN30_24900 [Sandaracinus sp.]|nr:hypothetical protein [Sandaracinus sp.]|tara:strand:- start:1095 stop:3170 length:2076 start_codon:yes stop_codon:yes gene_type:complete